MPPPCPREFREDVARPYRANLAAPAPASRAFNVASGSPHTVGEMACALAVAFGAGAPAPEVVGSYRLGDVRHVVASPVRAAAELGYRAAISFDDGMREFAAAPLR